MSVLSELAIEASPFPVTDCDSPVLPVSGMVFETPRHCQRVFGKGECVAFYGSIARVSGRMLCPHGFSVWRFDLADRRLAASGLVANPRIGGEKERVRAKEARSNHVSAEAVESWIRRVREFVETGEAEREKEFSRRLEALHEIRRFNQIIKTNMERVCTAASPNGKDPDRAPADLVRVFRASALISVQLDALDLLANPASAMSFKPRDWVFYRVVDKMVRIFEVLAEGRGVRMTLSGSSTAKILADERTIHIIPSAFIDNAIKYSKRGGNVGIHVGEGVRDNRHVVTCSVRSEGPPASAEEEQRLFKCRGRGEAARAMAEGTGVGLALAKVVSDQHGGTVFAVQRRTGPERSEWQFSCEIPVV